MISRADFNAMVGRTFQDASVSPTQQGAERAPSTTISTDPKTMDALYDRVKDLPRAGALKLIGDAKKSGNIKDFLLRLPKPTLSATSHVVAKMISPMPSVPPAMPHDLLDVSKILGLDTEGPETEVLGGIVGELDLLDDDPKLTQDAAEALLFDISRTEEAWLKTIWPGRPVKALVARSSEQISEEFADVLDLLTGVHLDIKLTEERFVKTVGSGPPKKTTVAFDLSTILERGQLAQTERAERDTKERTEAIGEALMALGETTESTLQDIDLDAHRDLDQVSVFFSAYKIIKGLSELKSEN